MAEAVAYRQHRRQQEHVQREERRNPAPRNRPVRMETVVNVPVEPDQHPEQQPVGGVLGGPVIGAVHQLEKHQGDDEPVRSDRNGRHVLQAVRVDLVQRQVADAEDAGRLRGQSHHSAVAGPESHSVSRKPVSFTGDSEALFGTQPGVPRRIFNQSKQPELCPQVANAPCRHSKCTLSRRVAPQVRRHIAGLGRP